MIKKVFLQTLFGTPHPWTREFFDDFKRLEKDGWYMKIFTKNTFIDVPHNIEIIPMEIEEFDALVKKYTGVEPNNYIDPHYNAPHKFISDYYPAYGQIFQDYTKDFDFWGHTNWDVVYGKIDHFFPDSLLMEYDIIADEDNAINGPFTVYKNNEFVNNLFREVPGWQTLFKEHELFYFDESSSDLSVLLP